MNFDDVSKLRDVRKYLNEITDKSLFIYSPTSLKINNLNISNKNIKLVSGHSITKNLNKINKLISNYSKFETIITFGGGSVTDIGKYISSKLGKKLICIPTMLSTNVYATDKVALIKDGEKTTLEAKVPDLILVDETLIEKAVRFNVYGLADVLSIYTALYDWDLDNKDNNVSKTNEYKMAEKLLNKTMQYLLESSYEEITLNPRVIFYLVGEAGYITNLYGSGKPESGSEHIFAKDLESKVNLPHAIAVSIGIVLMSLFQKNFNKDIVNCINKLKVLDNIETYKISKQLIKDILLNIKPRKDRYSIVNKFNKSEKNIDNIIFEFEELTGVNFYVDNK